MIIGRLFKKRGSFAVSLLACLAFVVAAILAWDLPLSSALGFALICLAGLLSIILAAALVVALKHLLVMLWRKLVKSVPNS